MKTIPVIFILILIPFLVFAEKGSPEASVHLRKRPQGVTYEIRFIEDFGINKEAPFRFNLLDGDKKEISKLKFSDFKKSGKQRFRFTSKGNESFVNYWFVACKYVNGEITGCKTFTDTIEIK